MAVSIPWWGRLALQRTAASLPWTIWLWKRYLRAKHLSSINEETILSALQQIEMARAHGLSLEGQSVLEIGSGWKPLIPLILRMAGANRVIMSDINQTMDRVMLMKALEQVRLKAEASKESLADLGLSLDRLMLDETLSFQDTLQALHLEYRIGPLESEPIDAIVSHNVLEHIPEIELPDILRRCAKILKPGGWMIHCIDHSDHLQHTCPSISPMCFLRFEETTWNRWSKGPFHQNRLRWFEYKNLFETAGFQILTWEKECYPSTIEEAITIPLCKRYKNTKPEDLAVLKSRVALRKI